MWSLLGAHGALPAARWPLDATCLARWLGASPTGGFSAIISAAAT